MSNQMLKKAVAGVMLALSLITTVVPVNTYAGVIGDGVKASHVEVQSSTNGNRAYGYVTMDTYHTTTVKLYHSGTEVKKGSNSGTNKVEAYSGYYTAYGTDLSARVFYK